STVRKASPAGCRGRRGVEQAQPAAGPGAVLGEQVRIVGTAGFLHEEPTGRGVRLVDESVVAERWDLEAGQNVLVNGALYPSDGRPAPLRDDGRSALANAVEPVHTALPFAHPQRRDRQRLGARIQLAPRPNGRMALAI